MTFNAFLERLERELERLPASHGLVFSAACCERAVPNLERYAAQTGAVDATAARLALDETWEFLGGRRAQLDVPILREACAEASPPVEDNHPLAGAATDAATMVDLLLAQVVNPLPLLSREIAVWAVTTIDNYLQVGPAGMQDPEAIQASDLMNWEIRRQMEDLERLERTPLLNDASLADFRLRAAADGSNLQSGP